MKEIKKILCPVHFGTEISKNLLDYIVASAKAFDAEILLLNVVHSIRGFENSPSVIIPAEHFASALETDARDKMDDLIKKDVFAGLKVSGFLLTGDPAEEIIKAAKDSHADAIIMSTNTRSEVGRFIFGSVAGKVVLASPVPVTTVRP